MKETKTFLIKRWETNLKPLHKSISHLLKNKGDISSLNLPVTKEGLVDLRGYSAPKEYQTVKSNSGRVRTYVSSGIRIKRIIFDKIDLSFSDFECCEFYNCHFSNTKFEQSRMVATNFYGCEFMGIKFIKTNFGYSTLQTSGLFFKKIKTNFNKILFESVNLSETHCYDQVFADCKLYSCKTGALRLVRCSLTNIEFSGLVKNLFIMNSRKVFGVGFSESVLRGLRLIKQPLEGFKFPDGDSYFRFDRKSYQLDNLKLPDHLTDDEIKLIDSIKFVWLNNKLETDFVDINWLNEDEIEIGKLIVNKLKTSIDN